jgi:hypothetical protein
MISRSLTVLCVAILTACSGFEPSLPATPSAAVMNEAEWVTVMNGSPDQGAWRSDPCLAGTLQTRGKVDSKERFSIDVRFIPPPWSLAYVRPPQCLVGLASYTAPSGGPAAQERYGMAGKLLELGKQVGLEVPLPCGESRVHLFRTLAEAPRTHPDKYISPGYRLAKWDETRTCG